MSDSAAVGLDFHGVPVILRGSVPEVLRELSGDFEYFNKPAASARPGAICLELTAAPPPPRPRGWPLFRIRDYAVYDRGGVRRIFYGDQACAEYDFSARKGRICCADAERLRELAYLAVLSRAGEALDSRGWHRVHALGFAYQGRGGLLLLPSGGGKSVMALQALRCPGFGIISDDTPLLARDLRLHAFPLRLGFRPDADLSGVPERWLRRMQRKQHGLKRLVDTGFFADRICTGLPLAWLLAGERRPGDSPRICAMSRLPAAKTLAVHLVLGAGIAQMSEYMVRPGDARALLAIAGSRARTAREILGAVQPRRFLMGSDPQANMAALRAFLDAGEDRS